MERLLPPPCQMVFVVKDALRGVRFVIKKSAKSLGFQNLPFSIPDRILMETLLKTETMPTKLEGFVDGIISLPLFDQTLPPTGFFGSYGFPNSKFEIHKSASVLYRALSFTTKKLGVKNVLMSEIACLKSMHQFLKASSSKINQKNEDKAMLLFNLLIECKALENPFELFRASSPEDQAAQATAVFAAVLWLFVPTRGAFEDETENLNFCCAIASQNSADFYSLYSEGKSLTSLFKSLLDVV